MEFMRIFQIHKIVDLHNFFATFSWNDICFKPECSSNSAQLVTDKAWQGVLHSTVNGNSLRKRNRAFTKHIIKQRSLWMKPLNNGLKTEQLQQERHSVEL